jgi:hypothetical protein
MEVVEEVMAVLTERAEARRQQASAQHVRTPTVRRGRR